MGTPARGFAVTRVLLTGAGPEHRYVSNRLVEAGAVDLVLVEHGRTMSRRQRVRQLLRRYGVGGLGSRLALATYRSALRDSRDRERALTRVLGSRSLVHAHPELVRDVASVNDPLAREIVGGLEEPRVLVYGTGIVGQRTLMLSAGTPLNMHTGMSPHYRGSSCAFWPVHNGELHRVGATVHEITPSVDGGRIYAIAQAALDRNDGLHDVFARAVIIGTDLYLEVLGRIDRPEYERSAQPQDLTVGVEYRAAMRGVRAEMRTRRMIRRGVVRDFCDLETNT